ncbi:hypothetical protein RSAG8_07382, partial [Rhizoctonia solani AG-8 WAC10335]
MHTLRRFTSGHMEIACPLDWATTGGYCTQCAICFPANTYSFFVCFLGNRSSFQLLTCKTHKTSTSHELVVDEWLGS